MTQIEKNEFFDKCSSDITNATKQIVRNYIIINALTNTLTPERVCEDLQFVVNNIKDCKIVEMEIKRFEKIKDKVIKEHMEGKNDTI